MKLSELIEGLQILKPHYKGGDGYHVGAEHDQFFAYATDTPLTPDEVKRMDELGWFQPHCGWEGPDSYKPSEGWSSYT